MDWVGFEPTASTLRRTITIDRDGIKEYLNVKALSGVCDKHLYETNRFLIHYLDYVDNKIKKTKSIEYFNKLKNKYAISSYRKQVYQILKLLRYYKVDWADEIKLPPEPIYYPKKISLDDIEKTINYFKNRSCYLRVRALILLGSTSGLRALELFQLTIDDIDLEKRKVYVNHNPSNHQSTKTKQNRVSFFSEEAEQCLSEYIDYFNNGNHNIHTLFKMRRLERLFEESPIQVKDLRKFFSQEWDRRGGPTSIKKILMGHSLKGDVDLMHYNAQSEDDLKKIYDKVMGENIII
jgi:integrase/recombinase XerD